MNTLKVKKNERRLPGHVPRKGPPILEPPAEILIQQKKQISNTIFKPRYEEVCETFRKMKKLVARRKRTLQILRKKYKKVQVKLEKVNKKMQELQAEKNAKRNKKKEKYILESNRSWLDADEAFAQKLMDEIVEYSKKS